MDSRDSVIPDIMQAIPPPPPAAQDHAEIRAFIEAFARINIQVIRGRLGAGIRRAEADERALQPDWDDPLLLADSGLVPAQVDDLVRAGRRYLHIDVAAAPGGASVRALFLDYTGLSDKQRSAVFPLLSTNPPYRRDDLIGEVVRLNRWQDWVRQGGFDPALFTAYRESLNIHGVTQNLSGAVGATGAAIAFIDAIRQLSPGAIVGNVGELPPDDVRSPEQIFEWKRMGGDRTVKALLLANGRALVFASSRDANIFQPLGQPFASAEDALRRFNAVSNDREERQQHLHEHAVGEVKTATDLANLHERMGLASRETQTELRTDRFLMMAVLNREILAGGRQRRGMNNRDVRRFSHVFNLHHCWGWDGGRERHPDHWASFVGQVGRWCGLPVR